MKIIVSQNDLPQNVEDFLAALAAVSDGGIKIEPALLVTSVPEMALMVEHVLKINQCLRAQLFESQEEDMQARFFPEINEAPDDEPELNLVQEQPITDVTDPLVLCAECRLPFKPDNKNQIYCKRPECKVTRQRRWVKLCTQRKKEREAENKAILTPDSDAPEMLVPDDGPATPAFDEYDSGDDPEVDECTLVWVVEDGPRAGTRLTTEQLKWLMVQGNLKNGQHIRHVKHGQHEVAKVQGSPAQKLKRLFGEDAPAFVFAGEL